MERIVLRAGPAGLVLAPALGGAVVRYWADRDDRPLEWLRAAPPGRAGARDPYRLSAFPLVPYSNRIREGRFRFGERTVTLPPNRPPERHAIHGQGWQAAWQPVRVEEAAAELEYRHAPDAWPWAYRARQRFTLAPGCLTVELELTNESDGAMPAGLGWHPYFVRTPAATVTASVGGMWRTDGEVLPTELLAPPPPACDPGRGLPVDAVALDNGFTGWDGRARIAWPERDAELVVTATPPLGFLTLYTPPRRDFFCLEPVSHATDAVNLAAAGRADTGLAALAPGASLRAAIRLEGRAA